MPKKPIDIDFIMTNKADNKLSLFSFNLPIIKTKNPRQVNFYINIIIFIINMFKLHKKYFISKKKHAKKMIKSNFSTAIFALIAGSVVGLLFSPKTGAENREKVKQVFNQKKQEFGGRSNDFVALAKEKFKDLKAKTENFVNSKTTKKEQESGAIEIFVADKNEIEDNKKM